MSGVEARIDREAVHVRARLDSPTYAWFQRLNLVVDVEVAAGYHVYADPAPAGSAPLSARVDPIDGLEIGTMTWPASRRQVIDGLDEEFAVHEGTLRTPTPVPRGEIAVFEPSERPIEFVANGATGFVLGSAAKHRNGLALGNYSVHTSAESLRQGESEIRRIGRELRADGTLKRSPVELGGRAKPRQLP